MIENECKTPIGCLAFIFYQKYFLWLSGFKAFLFWCGVLFQKLSFVGVYHQRRYSQKDTKRFIFVLDLKNNLVKINDVAVIRTLNGERISRKFKSEFDLELLNCWMFMSQIFRNNIEIFMERLFETDFLTPCFLSQILYILSVNGF